MLTGSAGATQTWPRAGPGTVSGSAGPGNGGGGPQGRPPGGMVMVAGLVWSVMAWAPPWWRSAVQGPAWWRSAVQGPGDLGAEGGGVAFQGGGAHVGRAGLEPGHRRLGRAHPGGDLGLGQPGLLPALGQLLHQPAAVLRHPPQRHLPEPGHDRDTPRLVLRRRGARTIVVHTCHDISFSVSQKMMAAVGARRAAWGRSLVPNRGLRGGTSGVGC